jgi:hypothetical protein
MSERRVLFVFAHQDDEVAVATRIVREVAAGTDVVCAFLTDGRRPEVRDAESRAVLESLGVRDIRFFGLPDGALVEHLEEALAALRSIGAVDEVVTLAWEGGHQDHDAAHLTALALGVPCFAFPLYNGKGMPGPLFRVMKPIERGRGKSAGPTRGEGWRAAMLCWRYRSQRWTWIGLFPELFWRLVVLRQEIVERAEHGRVLRRPHEGRLLYERRFGFPWERFAAAARPFIERHIVVQ